MAQKVKKMPASINPLLLIPNQKKKGFCICHDLRMLNATTVKEWGPPMNKMARIRGLQQGNLYNTFDLAKGFMQILIPLGDR